MCSSDLTLDLRSSGDLGSLTHQLYRFTEFGACGLRKLKVEYNDKDPASTAPGHPSQGEGTGMCTTRDAKYFSLVLAEVLKLNALSLRSLVLDLRSLELVNAFCPVVLTTLEPIYDSLRLETFSLTKPRPTTPMHQGSDSAGVDGDLNPVIFCSPLASSFLIFLEFLRSQARSLKSLAFPHFTNLLEHEARRMQLLDCLNPNRLQELCVPGSGYLRKNFLRTFTRLRLLFIGHRCGSGYGYKSVLNPTRFSYDHPKGRAGATCHRIRALSVCSKLCYPPGMLFHVVEKFPNLTSLELDTCGSAVFNDNDLQVVIKHLTRLQTDRKSVV